MTRTKIKNIIHVQNAASLVHKHVYVCGWIKTVRDQKSFCFIEINDGSTLSNLQIIVEDSLPSFADLLPRFTTGTSLGVKGKLVESPGKNQALEIKADEIHIFGDCDPQKYQLQKKRHTFEFLRTIAHLRPRTNTQGAVTRVRNALAFATHLFFQGRGFLYVHTPIIAESDCEGAGEMFRVTTLDPTVQHPGQNANDFSKDFFKREAFLTVSGQLEGEIYASALSDIYTFGPTFRAENSNTSRHLAEFWMIEPEMAFCELLGNIECAESYIKFVTEYALKHCQEDMEFFDKFIENGLLKRLENVLNTPFDRMTYTEAIRILEKAPKKFEFPVKWGIDLQSEHERYLSEEYCKKPVVLTDYPADIKAFYMRLNDDEKTVRAMDVLVPKIGELLGGSQREERHSILEKKFETRNLPKKD